VQHGIEPERLRLSQSAGFEPVAERVETAWQRNNSRVEVYLLSEVASQKPGTVPRSPIAKLSNSTPHGD